MLDNNKTTWRVDFDQFEVFPWNRNFETGHAVIDEQHRTLVRSLNKLARTLVNDEVIEVNRAFDELAEYANFHFADEEAIWAEYFRDDYWLSSHQLSHAAFLPKVIELKNKDEGKSLTDAVENIVRFLIRWLAFHIIDNDKRMALAVDAMASGMSVEDAKVLADKKMSGSMRLLIETILYMYDGLSSRALDLMRERLARISQPQTGRTRRHRSAHRPPQQEAFQQRYPAGTQTGEAGRAGIDLYPDRHRLFQTFQRQLRSPGGG